MQKYVYFIIVVMMSVSHLMFAKASEVKPQKQNSKIVISHVQHHFLDVKNEMAIYSPEERAQYVAFIYALGMWVDIELNKDNQVSFDQNSSPAKESNLHRFRNEWNNKNLMLESIFHVDEANAAFPLALVPVAGPVVARGLALYAPRFLAQASRIIGRTGRSTKSPREGWDGKFTDVRVKGESVLSQPATRVQQVAAVGTAIAVGGAAGLVENKSADDKLKQEQADRARSIAQSNEAAKDPKAVGSFCIFGGYASRYAQSGARRTCPAPQEAVNNSMCEGKANKPSFLCQSFGLSKGQATTGVADQLCLTLFSDQGLKDLTLRCSQAFTKFASEMTKLNIDEFSKMQDTIRTGIEAIESEKGLHEVGLAAYCDQENKLNRGAQKVECSSLLEIMNQFKKDFPRLAQNSRRNPTAPVSAASAADGGASRPAGAASAPAGPASGAAPATGR